MRGVGLSDCCVDSGKDPVDLGLDGGVLVDDVEVVHVVAELAVQGHEEVHGDVVLQFDLERATEGADVRRQVLAADVF